MSESFMLDLRNPRTGVIDGQMRAKTQRDVVACSARLRANHFEWAFDAGAISINDSTLTAFMWEGEKHSFKTSGLGGSRMGAAGLLRFVRSPTHLDTVYRSITMGIREDMASTCQP